MTIPPSFGLRTAHYWKTIFLAQSPWGLLNRFQAIPARQRYSEGLKLSLLIFSDRIFDSRVDRGMPSLVAAPEGPKTRPALSRRAASIMSFSSAASFSERSGEIFGSVASGWRA